MAEATNKKSVRITLLNSALSPPIYILASFTNPRWQAYEMKYVGVNGLTDSIPSVPKVDYTFWRRFDIEPGVWKYIFRAGFQRWYMYDSNAGNDFNKNLPKQKLIHLSPRWRTQAMGIT